MSTGELEPKDSRNVTGTSTNQTGDRWSEKAQGMNTPDAAGDIAAGDEPGRHDEGRGGPSFTDAIQPHMAVVGSDGGHVGTVDHIDGERIKLTKADAPEGHQGHHHYLPLSAVAMVEGGEVRLRASAADARGMTAEQ